MLIAIPLLLIPVILYNIVVLFGAPGDMGMAQADAILRDPMFSIPMASGARRSPSSITPCRWSCSSSSWSNSC